MVNGCFNNKFSADFLQCWSNKLESNPPHLWPRRPLYTVLKRKTYKKEIQKAHTAIGSQAEAGDKSMRKGQSPHTHPLQGRCLLYITDSRIQTFEFSSSISNTIEQSFQFLLHRHMQKASFLPGRWDVYLNCLHPRQAWISKPLHLWDEPTSNSAKVPVLLILTINLESWFPLYFHLS